MAFAMSQSASASLVYDSKITASAQGFGNTPKDLTLQATGQTNFESGSISVFSTGAIAFGNAISISSVFMSNGVENLSSLNAMPNPLADNQKYGIPTTGSLGITSADQIAVLFNATEPSGDRITVTDLTLKFFASNRTFLGVIDGQREFENSFAGNGVAGFTFVVDQVQQAFVNSFLAMGGARITLALEASITNFAGGPKIFLIYKINSDGSVPPSSVPPSNVPEPGTVALLGLGLLGFTASRHKSAKSKNT